MGKLLEESCETCQIELTFSDPRPSLASYIVSDTLLSGMIVCYRALPDERTYT